MPRLRDHQGWLLEDSAPVMPEVCRLATRTDFAFRPIIDARLALTLRHHGVTEFAALNAKGLEGFVFTQVWNPVEATR